MYVVAALYHFASLPDFESVRESLLDYGREVGVNGTMILAPEGINGTITGTREAIDLMLAKIRSDERLAALEHKESFADEMPFPRFKIKLKREIVTMGVPTVDPSNTVGTYVEPDDWNALIENPDVLVIDTRNTYEIKVGTFKHAISPETDSFREFPAYVEQELKGQEQRPIAMFCTGGIRCEKATSYLKDQGFEQVYHLHGGILKYLEKVPEPESLWDGECYVFDERVAVRHGLEQGETRQCNACGEPLSVEDQASPDYEIEVSCPHCIADLTPERRAMLEFRREQRRAR